MADVVASGVAGGIEGPDSSDGANVALMLAMCMVLPYRILSDNLLVCR